MDIGQALENDYSLDSSGGEQFLSFILAEEEYAVDILRVQEIKGWTRPTPIPNTPRYLKGVINLRGTIVPIVDLRQRFGLKTLEYGPTTVVIVLRVDSGDRERIMGIVVDAVSEVYNIPTDEVQEAPEIGASLDIEFVKGLATIDEKMVILLDIDHLLNSGDLSTVMEAADSAASDE